MTYNNKLKSNKNPEFNNNNNSLKSNKKSEFDNNNDEPESAKKSELDNNNDELESSKKSELDNNNDELESNEISKLGLNQTNSLFEDNSKFKNIIYKILLKRNIKVSWELIDKYFLRYNITKNSPKNVLNQMINDIRNENNIKPNTSIYNPKNIELTELVYIDSNDRDIEKWKNPSFFSIDLTTINNFTNILSIQLISAIFPKKINDTENIDDYPYIILEISELGANYKSINKNINNAFALLTFDIDLGKYKKLLNKSNVEYKKNFIPPISISELNIRIKNPNGNLLNFKSIKNTTNSCIKNDKLIGMKTQSNNISDEPEPNKLIYNPDTNDHISDEPNKFMSINFIFEIKYKKYDNTLQLFN